jgi:hypothetical protein
VALEFIFAMNAFVVSGLVERRAQSREIVEWLTP